MRVPGGNEAFAATYRVPSIPPVLSQGGEDGRDEGPILVQFL